jgi:putative secretion ATPase (PEP-CTERM system associated)
MYESFYKLSGKPFQLLPDTKIIFPSSSHKRALSYLLYGIEQGEGFIVITGDVGTGKTTLIQTLLSEIQTDEIIPINIAAANMDDSAIIHSIAQGINLQLDDKNKVTIIRELKNMFNNYHEQNKRVLVIVDEAQTLSWEALEELRILSNLESGGKALLQVFLVGQTELRFMVHSQNSEQLRQRIIASYNLSHLSERETKKYIQYRLEKVGWNNDPAIDKSVFELIYDWSEGIPRKINLLCDRLFLYGYLEKLHRLQEKHIQTVIAEMEQEIDSDDMIREKSKKPTKKRKRKSGSYNANELVERIEKLEENLSQLTEDIEYEKKLLKLLVKHIEFEN